MREREEKREEEKNANSPKHLSKKDAKNELPKPQKKRARTKTRK
jgi:hypothetical protein